MTEAASEPLELYQRAMDHLSGNPGREAVDSAVALLERASEQGHFAAGERLAAFHAMAANGPGGIQHWEFAFDELARAASQGSRAAAGQLLLLTDPAHDPVIPSDTGADFWSGVRARIHPERMLQAPARKSLSDAPRIRVIEGFATAAECRWVIASSREHMARATVFDRMTGQLVEDPARDNSAVSLMFAQMDVVSEILRTRISIATRVPVRVFEPAQILRYQVGQQFVPHHDFLDAESPGFEAELGASGQRIATFLIYLNDEYEGGETAFPEIGVRFRGKAGDALFWANLDPANQPDRRTLHAGLPPTAGEKWIFSQWIRERIAPPPAG